MSLPPRLLLALAVGLTIAGCGAQVDGIPREPVSGKVSLDGKALDDGQITFSPADGGEPAKAYRAYMAALEKGNIDALAKTMTKERGDELLAHKNDADFKMMFAFIQGTAMKNPKFVKGFVKGDTATLYINGERFNSITGVLPNEGQHLGFTVEAPEKGKVAFAIDNAEVRTPAANADRTSALTAPDTIHISMSADKARNAMTSDCPSPSGRWRSTSAMSGGVSTTAAKAAESV